jgi:peptide/nickel transport system ATP-binding protein
VVVSALEFRDVTVRFGTGHREMTAVDDVRLCVEPGTVVGLVGESGSGKSTLARAGVGLVPCTAGGVYVDDRPVVPGGRGRRHTGPVVQLVFQDPYSSLDPRMTVGDTIAEAIPRRLRLNRRARAAEVARLLGLVRLEPEHASVYPRHMSGGQRQRVAIARALAARPEVLIADEITSALDASVQGSILNLVRELQRDLNLTMLYISHNLGVIRYVCDVIAVMYLGRIVEVATSDELLSDPQHPYTRSLLQAIPRIGTTECESYGLGDRDEVMAALAHDPPDPRTPPTGCRFHTRCPVGPLHDPARAVCIEVNPNEGADGRLHHSACHFSPSVDDRVVSGLTAVTVSRPRTAR